MATPTNEELQLGEQAYHQVRFYEKYLAKKPLVSGASFAVFVLTLEIVHLNFDSLGLIWAMLYIIGYLGVFWLQSRWAKQMYAKNKVLLNLLNDKYGSALPWVKEEKTLAEARELEAAMARGFGTSRSTWLPGEHGIERVLRQNNRR